MEKNVKSIPMKVCNSKEYIFRLIGTTNTFRYDVSRCEFQVIVDDLVIKRYHISMSYKDFEIECRKMFLRVIQLSFGWN
jgi:hypothetical protein